MAKRDGSEGPTSAAERTSPVAVGADVTIGGNIKAGDIIGGSRIITASSGRDIVVGRNVVSGLIVTGDANAVRLQVPQPSKEVLSSEQALGRISDAVRLNLEQLQLNMEQARRESSQFFRTTMIFSGIAFAIILIGICLMLVGLVTVGIVTTAASIIPEVGALILFNKDKELRKTIETYHGYILESQRVLTMIDLAETMGEASARDSVKEQIVFAVLKIIPSK